MNEPHIKALVAETVEGLTRFLHLQHQRLSFERDAT
jgi:hypothetical protein